MCALRVLELHTRSSGKKAIVYHKHWGGVFPFGHDVYSGEFLDIGVLRVLELHILSSGGEKSIHRGYSLAIGLNLLLQWYKFLCLRVYVYSGS